MLKVTLDQGASTVYLILFIVENIRIKRLLFLPHQVLKPQPKSLELKSLLLGNSCRQNE